MARKKGDECSVPLAFILKQLEQGRESYTGPSSYDLFKGIAQLGVKDSSMFQAGKGVQAPKPSIPKYEPMKWLEKGAAHDDVQPVLTWGVCMDVWGARAAVTADGYRIHMTWEGVEDFDEYIHFKDSWGDEFEGQYPDIRAVLPSRAYGIGVYAADLYRAVKRALVFARDSANSVKFAYHPPGGAGEPGSLEVTGISAEYGDCTTLIDVASDIRNPYTWSANGTYVLEALIPYLKKTDGRTTIHVRNTKEVFLIGEPYQQMAALMPMTLNEQSRKGIDADGFSDSLIVKPHQPQQAAPKPITKPAPVADLPAAEDALPEIVDLGQQVGGLKLVVRVA